MLLQAIPYRADQHRINVIMSNGRHHHVTPRVLDVLLDSNRVANFERSGGWVTVGVDPIRAGNRNDDCPTYDGTERRTTF